MASYTTNLNLKKPAGSENVAIGDINGNMDTIDSAYGSLNSKTFQQVYNDYIDAGTSKTYTLTSNTQCAQIIANNGNGVVAVWMVSFRTNSEIGISQITTATASATITTSGMTFTVACQYSARVKVVVF